MGGPQPERHGKYKCSVCQKLGMYINVHTGFHVSFGFSIELCVFYSVTSQVLGVHSFQGKQLLFSRHTGQCIMYVM